MHGFEKSCLKNHAYVHYIFHSLKVRSRIFHDDQSAALVLQVMTVDSLKKFAADPELLVRRHDKNLRDCDCSFGHFEVLFKRSSKSD
jgi:uncharacterized protein YbcV (DUF1398 family)